MKFKIGIIIIIVCSCKKKIDFSEVQVIGHGGNGVEISNSIYHDNTQESIDLALAQNGCDGVEIDVQLSKSGSLWLYHDPELNSETNGKSCVNSLFDEEISLLNYSSINKEELIRLKDLRIKSKHLFLDLKHANLCLKEYVNFDSVVSEIQLFIELNPSVKVHVITTNTSWLPGLILSNFSIYFEAETIDSALEIVNIYNIEGLVFKNQHLNFEGVQQLKNLNKKVVIFEIRSPKGIREALNKLPNAVLTDDIKATLIEKY